MKHRLICLLGLGGLLIAYLSLRPSPSLSELSWLPSWLGEWADAPGNGDRRTAIPFFLLSGYLAMECCLVFRASKARAHTVWLLGASGLLLLLGMMEGLQLILPTRSASAFDLAWGSFGILLGGLPLGLRTWAGVAKKA